MWVCKYFCCVRKKQNVRFVCLHCADAVNGVLFSLQNAPTLLRHSFDTLLVNNTLRSTGGGGGGWCVHLKPRRRCRRARAGSGRTREGKRENFGPYPRAAVCSVRRTAATTIIVGLRTLTFEFPNNTKNRQWGGNQKYRLPERHSCSHSRTSRWPLLGCSGDSGAREPRVSNYAIFSGRVQWFERGGLTFYTRIVTKDLSAQTYAERSTDFKF